MFTCCLMVRDATIRNGIVDTNIFKFKLINPIRT